MPHDERYSELAAVAALGALDGDDGNSFAAHRDSGCGTCERELAQGERDLSLLAGAAVPADPPARVRTRLLKSIPKQLPRPAAPLRLSRMLAIAAAVALALLAADDLRLRDRAAGMRADRAALEARLSRQLQDLARQELRARFAEDPDVSAVLLSGLAAAPRSRGKILYSPRARRAILLAVSLPSLPPERQYELWFLSGGKAIPAGVFNTDASGAGVLESEALPESVAAAEKFAVTVEPRGGVAQPTGAMVLVGG